MKVSRSKTIHVCESEAGVTVKLQMLEVVKVDGFKYLGSTMQTKGQCSKEVKKRVQAGECWWIQVSGLMSNRKKAARKIYKVVVRDAMM